MPPRKYPARGWDSLVGPIRENVGMHSIPRYLLCAYGTTWRQLRRPPDNPPQKIWTKFSRRNKRLPKYSHQWIEHTNGFMRIIVIVR